jgi:hypothetical protein
MAKSSIGTSCRFNVLHPLQISVLLLELVLELVLIVGPKLFIEPVSFGATRL